jgi:hypothetical protein
MERLVPRSDCFASTSTAFIEIYFKQRGFCASILVENRTGPPAYGMVRVEIRCRRELRNPEFHRPDGHEKSGGH